ncbi:MAG TPA: flagellar motor protein MotB [Lacunisphaera sp.]|jgi:chemotaxis protein MotB
MAGSGGAWKVAFADFMTAMMALFLVLWISSQDKKILIATAQYFKNPFNSPLDKSAGVMPFNNRTTSSTSSDEGAKASESKRIETVFLNTVAADFFKLLHLDESAVNKPVDIQVTSDGLRITLFDRSQKPLFEKNTANFTEWGTYAMQGLAWTIDRHHFRVTIDGHTVQPAEEQTGNYTDWELSADRANAARRSLVHYAVEPQYIERVTGYAGTKPLDGEKPGAESNDRITLSLTLTAKTRKALPLAKNNASVATKPGGATPGSGPQLTLSGNKNQP